MTLLHRAGRALDRITGAVVLAWVAYVVLWPAPLKIKAGATTVLADSGCVAGCACNCGRYACQCHAKAAG